MELPDGMKRAASRRAAKEAGTTAHRLRLAPSQASRQLANLPMLSILRTSTAPP
jgi:hypothetical protein